MTFIDGMELKQSLGSNGDPAFQREILEALNQIAFNRENLEEAVGVTALDLQYEDRGWQQILWNARQDLFTRDGLRRLTEVCRYMALKNPIAKRALKLWIAYCFGQGLEIKAKSEVIRRLVVDPFFADNGNAAELGHAGRLENGKTLKVDGNLFFTLFVNGSTGFLKIRSIPYDEVVDIRSNPQDRTEPWFYHRCWTEVGFDWNTGQETTKDREAYYPDWKFAPPQKRPTIGSVPIHWNTPIYHVKVGGLKGMKFGLSELYAAIDWAWSYKEFLTDWASVVRALSQFAWKRRTDGGAKGVAAAKSQLATTLSTGAATPGLETNPAPLSGSTAIFGGKSEDLDPIRTANATTPAETGRPLLRMAAAGLGFPEHFFGDSSVGNHATSKTLDRPTELEIEMDQALWADVYRDILGYAVERAARTANGPLRQYASLGLDEAGNEALVWAKDEKTGEPIDPGIDVDYPPVLQHEMAATVSSIVNAATLGGNPPSGTLDKQTTVRLLLSALGDDDIADTMARMFPPDETNADPWASVDAAKMAQQALDAKTKAAEKPAPAPKPGPAMEPAPTEAPPA